LAERAQPHLPNYYVDSMFDLSADPRCQWDGINDVDRSTFGVFRSVMHASQLIPKILFVEYGHPNISSLDLTTNEFLGQIPISGCRVGDSSLSPRKLLLLY